jgi:hypothetical protein
MTKTFWIADPEGILAPVDDAATRDRWIRVHGWTEAAEPDRHSFVWLRHEDPALGPIQLTWEAAQLDAWAGRGWTPGAPDEPAVDLGPAVEPKSSPKSGSAAGEKKE